MLGLKLFPLKKFFDFSSISAIFPDSSPDPKHKFNVFITPYLVINSIQKLHGSNWNITIFPNIN